jgi:hypothetical protein
MWMRGVALVAARLGVSYRINLLQITLIRTIYDASNKT